MTGPSTGPMANAMANAQSNQRRRLSITTLGLSGSPTQTLQYGNKNFRQGSISSSVGSSPGNAEEAIAEDGENSPPGGGPKSPFARRLSFGAQALRDARSGSIGNGEGFNWSEALRTRAERGPISPNAAHQQAHQAQHRRAASIASMEQPAQEMPKQPKQDKKPDFFQEKILRGDFMD